MELPALITMLALLETLYFSFRVGMGRGKYGIEAPATSGHPEFDRLPRANRGRQSRLRECT